MLVEISIFLNASKAEAEKSMTKWNSISGRLGCFVMGVATAFETVGKEITHIRNVAGDVFDLLKFGLKRDKPMINRSLTWLKEDFIKSIKTPILGTIHTIQFLAGAILHPTIALKTPEIALPSPSEPEEVEEQLPPQDAVTLGDLCEDEEDEDSLYQLVGAEDFDDLEEKTDDSDSTKSLKSSNSVDEYEDSDFRKHPLNSPEQSSAVEEEVDYEEDDFRESLNQSDESNYFDHVEDGGELSL